MSDRETTRVSAGCGGCLGCIGTILVIWAFFFGVTWGGIHYEIGCSTDQGVALEEEESRD